MGVAVLAPTVVLAPLAVAGDVHRFVRSPWLIALDVAVGVAFGLAALPGRILFASVGWAWLIASFVPSAGSVHLGLLALGLLSLRGRRFVIAGLLPAVVVGFGVVPQVGVAVFFAVVAIIWFPRRYLWAAAVAVALARLGTLVLEPDVGVVVYSVTLLGVALAFPFANRAGAGFADRILRPEMAGLDGLRLALADTLSDPSVTIDFEGPDGLRVEDDDGLVVAFVHHSSPALDDPRAAASVTHAVRLVLIRARRQHEHDDLLRRQVSAQARLVAAADRQREQIAAELKQRVEAPLASAGSALGLVRSDPRNADASAALEIVAQELDSAIREINALVWAVPQTELGDGGLGEALRSLAGTSPVPASVAVAAAATREVETAVFYVCCEALANAVKHAGANSVRIVVERRAGTLLATVTDDGRGGADPTGSGLQGLADRLATIGGRLSVDSPPGAGTTVAAAVPVGEASPG
jgi:signal transduction histidine kinase